MKIIKYDMCVKVNFGTEENPDWQDTFSAVEMGWNEINEETAKVEAYNGVYTIEDDGQPEPEETKDGELLIDELAAAILEGVNDV